MTKFLPFLCCVFGFLAAAPFLPFESLFLWKLIILSTEFGNWLALGSLAMMFLCLFLKSGFSRYLLTGISLASAVVFLMPFANVGDIATKALQSLDQHFPKSKPAENENPNLWSSFLPTSGPKIIPQTFEFAPGLMLDFYPAVVNSEKGTSTPWLVVIYGGGWSNGDRKQLPELNSYLANRGISVVAVSYRLAPKAHWPDQREDVKSAIRFSLDHAQAWKLDVSRYAVLGRSAGGQIAESIAFSSTDPGLKGCIAFYAPADLEFAYQFGSEDDVLSSLAMLRDYMGGGPENLHENLKDASPIELVSERSPPTLLLHGTKDNLVWVVQSRRLKERLEAKGVPVVFVELPWATHGFDYTLRGPGGLLSTMVIEKFLNGIFQR